MGLFEAIFGSKQKQAAQDKRTYWQTLNGYTPYFSSWNGNAYENLLIRASIDARARHISKLKVECVGTAKDKVRNAVKNRPNSFQTWSQFLYRLSTILDMQNSAIIVPILDEYGRTNGFFPILPDRTEIVTGENNVPYFRYEFSNGEKAAIEKSLCGIMTKFQYKDDVFGTPSEKTLKETLDLMTLQGQSIKEATEQSGSFRFMAKLNNFSKNTDLRKEAKRFTVENMKSDNGVLLFPSDYEDVKEIKSTPYVMDTEQGKQIKENVFNYYGVNENVLQNKCTGEEYSSFYEGAVEPFAVQLSEVLTGMTFTSIEQTNGNGFVVSSNRLQYLSNADKNAISQAMGDRGIMDRNEIRDIWQLPPIPEEEGGSDFTIRGEYYMLKKDGSVKSVQAASEPVNATTGLTQTLTNYNGSKINALLDIIRSYKSGEFSREQAINIIVATYGYAIDFVEGLLDKDAGIIEDTASAYQDDILPTDVTPTEKEGGTGDAKNNNGKTE